MMVFYAGLDVGGTTGRIKLEDDQGRVIGEFYGKGGTMNTDGFETCNRRYREFVLPVLETQGLKPEDCQRICIAASGIDSPKQEEECRRSFEEMGFPKEGIKVCNDCEVFLYESSGPAMVLVCGTGSIAFARSASGEVCRCGGWGHVLSDEGSGHNMGMMVIREAANHIDGRGSCPVLFRLFSERTGLKTLNEINTYVNEMLMEKSDIASLAPLAEEAYRQGDETGLKIMRECRDALFGLVHDIYFKAGLDQYEGDKPVELWFWGSVLLKNRLISEELQELVNRELPTISIKVPERTALDIALDAAKRGWT